MKYRDMRALPSSVAVWLEQQLEELGIDSSLYTRYVLSLLQDESPSYLPNSPPSFTKGVTKGFIHKNHCSLEELKRCAVVECLSEATSNQSIDIESLVDELCTRLTSVNSSDWNTGGSNSNCLKEKTNSEDLKKRSILNIGLELPGVSNPIRYTSAFPALSRETERVECSLLENTAWTKNICRALGRRKDSESSPKENKIIKRKEGNKENARGRMRSRSSVKREGGSRSQRSGMATSLDRVGGGNRRMELELPMDFQSLLQSPPEEAPLRAPGGPITAPSQFIQHGTNITSSIWTDLAERMDEEDSVHSVGSGYVGWSNCRRSLLSSSWKHPFDYTIPSTVLDYRQKDIEGTALNLNLQGSKYFSLFANNSANQSSQNCFTHFETLSPPNKEEVCNRKEEVQSEQLENLLTSMKTHFKPIKEDTENQYNSCEPTNKYNDGMSFVNVASLQEVKYDRSSSGSLRLGPTGDKYMEFHRKDLVDPNFVPKFKVLCSNEKECQTDDPIIKEPPKKRYFDSGQNDAKVDNIFSMSQSVMYGGCPILFNGYDKRESEEKGLGPMGSDTEFFLSGPATTLEHSEEAGTAMENEEVAVEGLPDGHPAAEEAGETDTEFFFPGDERYAQIMVDDEDAPRIQLNATFTAFPISNICGDSGSVPSPRVLNDIWSNFTPWVKLSGDGSGEDGESGLTRSQEYSRLVDEVTAEGEQLLSDLSMHLLQDPRTQNALLTGWKPTRY